jgi:hypothetical protein
MKADKTTEVSGTGLLVAELVEEEISLQLTPGGNAPLIATTVANTVSISRVVVDSGGAGEVPGPDPDNPNLYFGTDSFYFGYGSYPLNGFQ